MKYLKALNRQVMLVLRRVVLKLIGLHVDKILSDGFPWFFPLVFFFFHNGSRSWVSKGILCFS